MSLWYDFALRLDEVYANNPVAAKRQLKNAAQLMVLSDTRHKFFPIRRLADGISGRDMSSPECLAQELQRYRHELNSFGFREVTERDHEHQNLLSQLTELLETQFQTKPSPSIKTFWVSETDIRDSLMHAFQLFDDHGTPDGFKKAQKWFVSHPNTQAPYPAKIIWGIATNVKGAEVKSRDARKGLRKAGFECADLSESPPTHIGKRYFKEGALRTFVGSKRERNPVARALCIKHYRKKNQGKLICTVCRFDFSEVYGRLGDGFMHVHHLDPISEAKSSRLVSPEFDLVPVCPNCHSMIHRGGETRSIAEMREIIDHS